MAPAPTSAIAMADELAVRDAVVGVADHQLARLAICRLHVRQLPGLVKSAAAQRRGLFGKLDRPVTLAVVIDADRGIGSGWHGHSVPRRGAQRHLFQTSL